MTSTYLVLGIVAAWLFWRARRSGAPVPTTLPNASGYAMPPGDVRVLWRPGCPYCASLFAGLRRSGIEYDRVDIWEHADAAALVRTITGGSETVPTVIVGDVALVNPRAAAVAQLREEQRPQ